MIGRFQEPRRWAAVLMLSAGLAATPAVAGPADTYFEQLHDKEFSPEEAFLDKDFKDRIRHLCSALKSPYREVALEHFCEEKTAAEIAKAQNKNIKTVQTQIYRSRSMLKALLERSD